MADPISSQSRQKRLPNSVNTLSCVSKRFKKQFFFFFFFFVKKLKVSCSLDQMIFFFNLHVTQVFFIECDFRLPMSILISNDNAEEF